MKKVIDRNSFIYKFKIRYIPSIIVNNLENNRKEEFASLNPIEYMEHLKSFLKNRLKVHRM